MAAVTSEQVAAYLPLIESSARLQVGRAGAEYDDLVQEGMIAVFLSLKRGNLPSREVVLNRQTDWVRYLHRLRRMDSAAYEQYLPTEVADEPERR